MFQLDMKIIERETKKKYCNTHIRSLEFGYKTHKIQMFPIN